MSDIILQNTLVKSNRVEYEYSYPDAWKVFLSDPNERLFNEYDFDITSVPKSILNIPFVANMITLAMFENYVIEVDELDKEFFECIDSVIDGYKKLYGSRIKGCTVKCNRIVDNKYECSDDSVKICAFTGGVDATSAVASHKDEKLVLANIWGGDIKLDNTIRRNSYLEYYQSFCKKYGFGFASVKSNFRFIYDDRKIPYKFKHDWWSAIAHSLLIVSTLFPIAYIEKAKKIYIASSYTTYEYSIYDIHCCNAVCIVNKIKFASCTTEQCDTNLKRSEKIKNIYNALKPTNPDDIKILACWNHKQTEKLNCCRCEKCIRTIMDILSNGIDPNYLGFMADKSTYKFIRNYVTSSENLPYEMWKDIQDAFLANSKHWKRDKRAKWILKIDINKPKKLNPIIKFLYRMKYKCTKKTKKFLK